MLVMQRGSALPPQSIPSKAPRGARAKGRGTLERGQAVLVLLCHRLRLAVASPSLPLAPGQAACS